MSRLAEIHETLEAIETTGCRCETSGETVRCPIHEQVHRLRGLLQKHVFVSAISGDPQ
jgi:hypothetical protein